MPVAIFEKQSGFSRLRSGNSNFVRVCRQDESSRFLRRHITEVELDDFNVLKLQINGLLPILLRDFGVDGGFAMRINKPQDPTQYASPFFVVSQE